MKIKFSIKCNAGRCLPPASGFTLVEVMIAIAFFSAVMVVLFGAFNAVFSNAEAIDDGIWIYDSAKTCIDRMITDLQSVHVTLEHTPPEFSTEKDEFRVEGESSDAGGKSFSKLRFTSFAHLSLNKDSKEGIAEIVYYVQAVEGGFVIRRADNLPPFEPFEEKASDPVLCENVKSLRFKFFDAEGTEYENWDSESSEFKYATPVAIGIKLEIGDEKGSYFFETEVAMPVFREEKEE